MEDKNKSSRSSVIWNYYNYDLEKDCQFCNVKVGDKICGIKISGKSNTSSAKYHLKAKHPNIFSEFEALDAEQQQSRLEKKASASATTSVKSKSLEESFGCTSKYYDCDGKKCTKIFTKFALFIASSSSPWNTVESDFFWDFLLEIDPRLPRIGRKKCSSLGKNFVANFKILQSIKRF